TVGGPSTHHLVSREVLQALGPKGIVVNIARGTVIDEQALVELLEQGLVGGAGLDVFEHEPKVPQALSSNDQVVVLPHIGSATNETRMDMENMLMQNIEAFFKTGKVITPIA
ncbi:MAG: NAD(P)-dependent oxidoreductase, partial [Burkholderiaceae bacterium]